VCAKQFYAEEATTYTSGKPQKSEGFFLSKYIPNKYGLLMTQMLYKKVACINSFHMFKGNFSIKHLLIDLMHLCATSPCVAFVRQWLNQGGVKFSAACGHTTLPVWPSTLARYYSISKTPA
jgi:hypothetical protein